MFFPNQTDQSIHITKKRIREQVYSFLTKMMKISFALFIGESGGEGGAGDGILL